LLVGKNIPWAKSAECFLESCDPIHFGTNCYSI